MDVLFIFYPVQRWPDSLFEPLIIGLSFPILNRDRGPWLVNRSIKRWWKMDVPCQVCQKHVTYQTGISCTNFMHLNGTFFPCRGAWCVSCFKAHYLDCFEATIPQDFHGTSLAEVEDEVRFRMVRSGDHLCTSFQCPNCQSQNIWGCDLDITLVEDDVFEFTCIRATVDVFWAHAFKTVLCHVSQIWFMAKYTDFLNIAYHFPRLGPFPLKYHN